MRLSQVLVIGAASFLFANEAIAVTMDSNQAKVSTMASAGPTQRLLRSYKHVEEDSDDLDDLDNLEERSGNPALRDLAKSWSLSFDDIISGAIRLTDEQHNAWKAIVNAGITKGQKKSRDAYNEVWRAKHGYGKRV
ncbi:Avirulence (Avh) protein [Phytophthora megakarya]|uniref:RxLR effector protein n=1 Tax=Phytophthora megakarya TaxID=4795 RepID=A0A225VGF0_9STRA|nr:Avirulence (Avh) protein [Phytophthora megakarya]